MTVKTFRNGARVRYVSYHRPTGPGGLTVHCGDTGTVNRQAISSGGRNGWPRGFVPVVWDETPTQAQFALAVFTRELEALPVDSDPTKGPKYSSG